MKEVKSRFDWTEEKVQILKDLWEETTLSASQIAGKIGIGLTRNAVIGKANRLKLSRKDKNHEVTGKKIRAVRKNPVAEANPAHLAKILEFRKEDKKALNLCSWPNGDPNSKDFRFCGEEVKKAQPYCSKHMERAYSKQKS